MLNSHKICDLKLLDSKGCKQNNKQKKGKEQIGTFWQQETSMSKNFPHESLILQNNIKNNAVEVQDFIKELKNWEKDIKKEDEKLSCQNKDTSKNAEVLNKFFCLFRLGWFE